MRSNELDTDALDAFRASRNLKPITSTKELQLLRQFCGFCKDRRWMDDNAAKRIKPPRNIRPNDVEPFSSVEVNEIIRACDLIGQTAYERLRARAMVLALRYTALRLGDVAMLARDRITKDGKRWRIFLRTEKSGKPVFLPIPTELGGTRSRGPCPAVAAMNRNISSGMASFRTLNEKRRGTLPAYRVQEVGRSARACAPLPAHAGDGVARPGRIIRGRGRRARQQSRDRAQALCEVVPRPPGSD